MNYGIVSLFTRNMGVCTEMYRLRTALFVTGHGSGAITTSSVIDCSRLVKVIGTVSFIGLLLVMSGVESNPGPKDQFNFRYQYLLIEFGTKVLRNLLDHLVNNDLMGYLNANPKQHIQLQFLIQKGVITTDQTQFLPPIDMNPVTSNFDITLLVCLLRNICGLRGPKDPVWKVFPAPGDFSIEADIVRLRQCRNNLAHSNTVFISETEFTNKWTELTDILNRLNKRCNISGFAIQTLSFNAAKLECIDENLKEKFDKAITAWITMEKSFEQGIEELNVVQSELKQGQTELKQGQSELKHGQTKLKHGQTELKHGQTELKQGQTELNQGQSELKQGQTELKQGQSELEHGQTDLKQGQTELKQDQSELKQGQTELKQGQSELKQGQADFKQGQTELKHGQTELKQGQSELKHGQYEFQLGQTELKHGQTELKHGQSELKHEQTELKHGQSELKQGQYEFHLGLTELKLGQTELKHVQTELKYGQSELKHGQTELKQGHCELQLGQSELRHGQTELNQGQSELKHGHTELKQGQTELKHGQSELRVVQSQIRDSQLKILSDVRELKEDKTYQTERMEMNDEKVSECKDTLVNIYKKWCCTLSVAPLCTDDDEVDLLTFYMSPELKRIPYHRNQHESGSVSSYEEIFSHEGQRFINIFITGDAGVGKTSFCKRMSLLWSEAQSGKVVDDHGLQKDIDFMKSFDFVFYVSLRETDQEDMVDMIVDQFFYTKSAEKREIMYKCIETIIKDSECLIILDALDEWTPKRNGAKECVLPKKIPSERCKYLTTCRPYKIEQNRLLRKDIDYQISMTGVSEAASESYVRKIVSHINEVNGENKSPHDFLMEMNRCGLTVLLNIPIILSQLVLVWLDKTLTEMPRAQIYSTILEMLLERAEQKDVVSPSSTDTEFQLPTFFSELVFVKKHISLIEKLCLLSFRSLFKQDQCVSLLVFTKQQLMQKPYFLSAEDTDFMYKIGILSKNKVIGRFGRRELKLSFLHKSYVEFFAALFVTCFDRNDLFAVVVEKWTTVNDVSEFDLFLLFLAGLSCQKTASIIEKIYLNISDSLNICRKKANFPSDQIVMVFESHKYGNVEEWKSANQIRSLQKLVLDCCQEVKRSNVSTILFKLEDYIFDRRFYNIPLLKQLCSFNQACVKFLYSEQGEYFDEFDQIKHLEHLIISKIQRGDYQKLEQMILRNQSTLRSLCIDGFRAPNMLDLFNSMHTEFTFILDLPVNSFRHLTSLTLCFIKMPYHNYENLILFLNENVLIENLKLVKVSCVCFFLSYEDYPLSLQLTKHTKLNSLTLNQVDVLCPGVNNSSLKSISLHPLISPLMDLSMSYYIDIFESVMHSRLEHIVIAEIAFIDTETMTKLINTLKSLPYIKSLYLINARIPDDILFQLHPDVTQVEIRLGHTYMTEKSFHSFIESFINNKKSVIKMSLHDCTVVKTIDERVHELQHMSLYRYVFENLAPKENINLSHNYFDKMYIEKVSCQ